ncbi:MAG TPA: EF-hand domain-containing protein [Aquimonas sp.]|nr:EF-hand domain-containing protein [Xanthomonadales bacterium]HRD73883.1 EF-hand domain-containing protein [Aquimonas sp.]HRF54876.1 EF-hand domain-containing protein [Aquimonas sp.]
MSKSVSLHWLSRFALCCALPLTAVSTSSLAADQALADAADAAFKAADFDANGKVSWEEFRNRVVNVFGHIDTNADGRIAGQEHPAAVDAKGNTVQPGNVTVESFTSAVADAFKAADKDGDGELSAEEWSGKKS